MTGYVNLHSFLPPWELSLQPVGGVDVGLHVALDHAASSPPSCSRWLACGTARAEVPFFSRARAGVRWRSSSASRRTSRPTGSTSTRASSRSCGSARSCACPSVSRAGSSALLALGACSTRVGMGGRLRPPRSRPREVHGRHAGGARGAKLLPLLFRRQLTSENTRSLLHAWGFYVMEKQTSAPLLFAHSRSLPGHVQRAAAAALQPPRARDLRAEDGLARLDLRHDALRRRRDRRLRSGVAARAGASSGRTRSRGSTTCSCGTRRPRPSPLVPAGVPRRLPRGSAHRLRATNSAAGVR